MIRRIMPMVLGFLVLVIGLAWADDPQGGEKPGDPVRLKRKKRAGTPPVKQPGKDDKDPAKEKPKEQPGKDKEEKRAEREDDPMEGEGDPEEDDKEILERVSRNMRAVEEKLGNRELG